MQINKKIMQYFLCMNFSNNYYYLYIAWFFNKINQMIDISNAKLERVIIHRVGNKALEDVIIVSEQLLSLTDSLEELLKRYFLSSFKFSELYNLDYDTSPTLNPLHKAATNIFDDNETLISQSGEIASLLYEVSLNPKIKGGELWVALFSNCIINDEVTDAVGLFRSENREDFLKIFSSDNVFEVQSDRGIFTGKLDKGCLIFNSFKDDGYIVAVTDNGKSLDSRFWIDDFLILKQREDDYFFTQMAMRLCHNFVAEKLPDEYQINRVDQADLLNKSMEFFKEHSDFKVDNFAEEVMVQPELVDKFTHYKKQFEHEQDIKVPDEFMISENAVKKQAKVFKSVIKLDKNFHIYVHGNREFITRGVDEKTGLNYYQVFFKEEN